MVHVALHPLRSNDTCGRTYTRGDPITIRLIRNGNSFFISTTKVTDPTLVMERRGAARESSLTVLPVVCHCEGNVPHCFGVILLLLLLMFLLLR